MSNNKKTSMPRRNKTKNLTKKEKLKLWMSANQKKVVGIAIVSVFIVAIVVGIAISTATGNARLNTGKPTVINIGSTGCPPCREMQPSLDRLKTEYGDKVEIVFYDAWYSVSGASMASKHNATSIPTLIFLNADGKVVGRLEGLQPYENLVAKYRSLGWIV